MYDIIIPPKIYITQCYRTTNFKYLYSFTTALVLYNILFQSNLLETGCEKVYTGQHVCWMMYGVCNYEII